MRLEIIPRSAGLLRVLNKAFPPSAALAAPSEAKRIRPPLRRPLTFGVLAVLTQPASAMPPPPPSAPLIYLHSPPGQPLPIPFEQTHQFDSRPPDKVLEDCVHVAPMGAVQGAAGRYTANRWWSHSVLA